ncbi:MAG: molecular chaperone HtpG [Bacteroidaceae bacterium]|nr:molecular chaperone HtpG [Bacteroidaceae bacterium]
MSKQKGTIGVTTENIFPVIKKFLYSDHEIFLREIVSNAIDATQKLKTLSSKGQISGDLGDLTIRVSIDKDRITVSDRGIGMTADEIEKYINQIAFSGANDFLEKYKDNANAIIGHFGLGFYSSFMVSKKVEIVTKSYKEDSNAVKWSCDGSPEYTMEKCNKSERGTDIIMYIDDDCKEYLQESEIDKLLRKYCKFLPVPIAFGKKKEWKDGKNIETDEDNIINNVDPLWCKTPSDVSDDDYRKFYHELYPMADDPLFWIHLNVDFPFHLTGILYFPLIKNNIELQRNKIQLYCNQVYVTDSVEGIVPDFLTLLHGIIDSPDIPLNVSRSYLQSDANVKKISGYILKKVADRLNAIFKNNRKEFEEKWDNLKLFINYGLLTEDELFDKVSKITLFKDTDGKYYTFDEYKTLIEPNQTDKDKQLVYLYANNVDAQYGFINAANQKGYNVLLMDGQLDVAVIGMLEQKFEKSRFMRVDSDSIDNLIVKSDKKDDNPDNDGSQMLSAIFKSRMPQMEKVEFHVDSKPLGQTMMPVIITQSEYMRRMKEMADIQAGMSFYGDMPSMYSVTVNTDHKLIQKVMADASNMCNPSVTPIDEEIEKLQTRVSELRKAKEGKKDDEIPEADKTELTEKQKAIKDKEKQKDDIYGAYARDCKIVNELVDLALLQTGMLKGKALDEFIKRSIELI